MVKQKTKLYDAFVNAGLKEDAQILYQFNKRDNIESRIGRHIQIIDNQIIPSEKDSPQYYLARRNLRHSMNEITSFLIRKEAKNKIRDTGRFQNSEEYIENFKHMYENGSNKSRTD